jgi:hypothetical protein
MSSSSLCNIAKTVSDDVVLLGESWVETYCVDKSYAAAKSTSIGFVAEI